MNNSLIGQTINNRYRLDAIIGDGGMGTAFRAFDHNLERMVAIKIMHGHFARQEEFRRRLVQEAQTAARLDHPSIVKIYDFGESDLGLFIAMEYVEGGSLRDHLQRLQRLNRFLPFSQSLQIAIQIADALDYAHRQGVIHRDVKPGNILLKRLSQPDEPGEQPFRALLTDFGLVKLQEGSPMTQSGATVGTPTYMSPEQCEGKPLDGRSDLYSLGVVLYELVTNRLPFSFQTLGDAISAHRRGVQPAPAREYRSDAPPLIDSLLMRALAKSPDNRFESGREMSSALRSALVSMEGAPTRVMTRQELSILDRVEDPPPGFDLEIDTPGRSSSVVPLTQSVITLGRNADNDVVLPAEGVSRHHARLQATPLGWEITDLGGINGTWIDDRRLRPEEPTPLGVGTTVRIGPYALTLRGPEIPMSERPSRLAATLPGATTPGLERSGNAPSGERTVVAAAAPLAMYTAQERISVDPGQQATIKVEVANRGEIDDRVTLRVLGIPTNWIVSRQEFVPLAASTTRALSVVIRPPRHRSTPTGRQRVRLQLVSQRYPDSNVATNVDLVLGNFAAFAASLEPAQVRLPGMVNVEVQNTGNAPLYFSVVARDREDALSFSGERGRILLQPDQVANVELAIEPRERSWLGASEIYPYQVDVVSRQGGRQTLTAEASTGGIIPLWLFYALIFLLTIACAFAAIAAVINRDRLFGPDATATLPVVVIDGTQTALAETATAEAPAVAPTLTALAATETAATAAAATADAQGDPDQDGLSTAQEQIIGTDPFNPDTDDDGLNDGQEVLIYGTNPLDPDTDNDQLSDGEEVLVWGSDPLNPDTNGNGILDGVEVALGRDPAATLTPTTQPTGTPPPTGTPVPGFGATQTAVAATQTSIATTLTAVAGANAATQTASAATLSAATSIAATQTAAAVGATQTAAAAATQTAIAVNGGTSTSVAATLTAIAGANATQTAIAGATQTAVAGVTQTAVAGATQTAAVGATQTAAAIATLTAAAPTETATSAPGGTGQILREYWLNIPGGNVSDLTSAPGFPNSPDGAEFRNLFEAPANFGDNYGTLMRGYIYPPTTGQYTFWIASDNASELWLSTSDNPAGRTLIAEVPTFTDPREWEKFGSQQSASITLQGGQPYYIEARHKEDSGPDNLAVAWEPPGGTREVIPGQYLTPFGQRPYP